MCIIFAKSGVELLLLSIGGKNQFWRWESWVLLIGLLVFALLQLWYLQKALVYADPILVCPLAFCFYNLSSIVNSLVYFDQFGMLSTLKLLLVSLGMVILLGGVWIVSFQAGGGGGVDIGSWEEVDEDLDDEASETGVETNAAISEPFAPRRLASAVSESEVHSQLSPPPRSSITFPSETIRGGQPPSPTTTRSPSTRRTRYSLLGQHPSEHGSGPSTLNVPAGGFSIGLSPVSPGFAIVPTKRRPSEFRRLVQRAAMRRTVSESDVRGERGGEQDEEEASEAQARPENTEERGRRTHLRAIGRWKWLRQMFTDRDT